MIAMHRKASIALACSYDSEVDAANIHLERPVVPGSASRQIAVETDIVLDLDQEGHPLGLEILDASTHLPHALLRAILDHGPNQTKDS
jgi:uncharacterized protein YuzE